MDSNRFNGFFKYLLFHSPINAKTFNVVASSEVVSDSSFFSPCDRISINNKFSQGGESGRSPTSSGLIFTRCLTVIGSYISLVLSHQHLPVNFLSTKSYSSTFIQRAFSSNKSSVGEETLYLTQSEQKRIIS